LKAARELRELIEAHAEAIEEQGTLNDAVVDALAEAGLFRLLVPQALGGFEADVRTIVEVHEEISFADGSVGWAYAQNTTVGGYAAYLAPEFARPLAGSKAGAGMFAPLGVAHEENGGYRVSGSYKFGSGSAHAEYMGGAAMVMRDGEMVPAADGLPEMRAFIVPMEGVIMKGNWDVMGLRGTGSYDFEIPEQWVEAGKTFPIFHAEVVTGGALYGLGPIVLGTISSVAWAIGVARRALHEIVEIAKVRARLGALPLRDQETFQRGLGRHTCAVRAARVLAIDAYQRAVEAIERGDEESAIGDRLRETKASATWVTEVAKQACSFAYESAGSHGMRNPSRLQRCFRDLWVGAAHQVFDTRNYNELVKRSLGLEPARF
jgi:alkylation response protein AidB-like acyl-CoA dehydrogenase